MDDQSHRILIWTEALLFVVIVIVATGIGYWIVRWTFQLWSAFMYDSRSGDDPLIVMGMFASLVGWPATAALVGGVMSGLSMRAWSQLRPAWYNDKLKVRYGVMATLASAMLSGMIAYVAFVFVP